MWHGSYGTRWTNAWFGYWGQVTHVCVKNWVIIGSKNGLSPVRHQAIPCTNDDLLLTETLGINFGEILFEIKAFLPKKTYLILSFAEWRPSCLGRNILV